MTGKKRNKNFGYYLAEILILIFGITASFTLNEFRIAEKERSGERDLLESFKENLVTDSTLLSTYLQIYERQIEIANNILDLESNAGYTDSTASNVLGLLSYFPFSPSDITYQEMKSLGQSHIIQNDSLLTEVISLYELYYQGLQEWTDVDGQHVKERMIPYLMENFPYVKGLNFTAMNSAQKRDFMRQVNSDRFRYIIQFGASFKTSTKSAYQDVLNEVRSLIDLINLELSAK